MLYNVSTVIIESIWQKGLEQFTQNVDQLWSKTLLKYSRFEPNQKVNGRMDRQEPIATMLYVTIRYS